MEGKKKEEETLGWMGRCVGSGRLNEWMFGSVRMDTVYHYFYSLREKGMEGGRRRDGRTLHMFISFIGNNPWSLCPLTFTWFDLIPGTV